MKKFDNFVNNLKVLKEGMHEDLEKNIVISGLINSFNIQFELSWKLLKKLLEYEGKISYKSGSPREILKQAFATFDFMDEEVWLEMLKSRNDATHIYDSFLANELINLIVNKYIDEFITMEKWIKDKYLDVFKEID